jgi:hypothetical protein
VDGKVYVLKGNKTFEFWCYDPQTGGWNALAGMPEGDILKPAYGGASMCSYDGRIFAFKGYRTTEFYTYDIGTDVWQRLADIPTRRVKDGACLACMEGTIYATVGGNKMGFWAYDPLMNVWTQLEDVPRDPDRRKVKYGASMATLDGTIMFLKGRKTEVLYAYEPVLGADRSGEMPLMDGQKADPIEVKPALVLSPNPAAGRVLVAQAAGGSENFTGRLYSSSGRLIREFEGRNGSAELDVSELANGVYLVRVEAGSAPVAKRLVIQH